MSNINVFIRNVESSRKRTGVLYCHGSFNSVIEQFKENIPDTKLLDCTVLFKSTLIFSASELLNQIENESKERTTIVLNIETFIVSNSHNFSDQLAKLLIIREPIKPLFFLFYSNKIFRQFKENFELKELNSQNILEL